MASRCALGGSTRTRFRCVLAAGNNETILTSERHVGRAGALDAIASVRANAPVDARYARSWPRTGSRCST